jgi:hypothetical protein
MEEKSIEDIEQKFKSLTTLRDALQSDVNRILAARDERKRSLKETIDECKKEGFNPDTLPHDIQHLKQVLITKLDVISADITEGQNMIRPMLREIERG